MNDLKLLELAAKAAGILIERGRYGLVLQQTLSKERRMGSIWNPLSDDGDALRLAMKLEMLIHVETCYYVSACKDNVSITEHIGNDGKGHIYAATRRAIVRAAAEIGKAME